MRRVQSQLLELDGQQRQTLVDIVMELSRQAASLLFLRFDQAAADRREGMVRNLGGCDIDTGAHEAGKGPVVVVSRDTHVQQRPVFPVRPPQPEFRSKWLSLHERIVVRTLVHARSSA